MRASRTGEGERVWGGGVALASANRGRNTASRRPPTITTSRYIDDLEIALSADGTAQVRSSSRVGFLDYGVNGKRLNVLAEEFRKGGWTAPAVSRKSHPNYCFQNAQAGDGAGCDL